MTHKNTDVMPCTRERTDFCSCLCRNQFAATPDSLVGFHTGYCCGVEISPDYPHAELDKLQTVQILLRRSPRLDARITIDDTGLTYLTSRTASSRIVEQCSWAMLPWCKREGSQAVAGAAGEMSRP